MHYKIYIYVVSTLFSAFALSGVNYEKFIKRNRIWETRVLVMLLSFALGYLVTQFFLAFI